MHINDLIGNSEYDGKEKATYEAMENLKVGYRFSEMYSFWVHVLMVREDLVVFMQQNNYNTSGWELKIATKGEFKTHFGYKNKPGDYWVTFIDLHQTTVENAKTWILQFLDDGEQTIGYATKILLRALINVTK